MAVVKEFILLYFKWNVYSSCNMWKYVLVYILRCRFKLYRKYVFIYL